MFKKPRFWLGIVSTSVFLYFLFRAISFTEFGEAMREANYLYLIPAVAIYFIAVFFRSARWHFLLKPIGNIPTRRLYPTVLIGFMVNNLLPVRVGELFRAYLLGDSEKISKSATLATIAMERILDAFVLVIAAFVISLFVSIPSWLETTILIMTISLCVAAVALAIMLVSEKTAEGLFRMGFRPLPAALKPKVYRFISDFLIGFRSARSPVYTLKALFFTVLTWSTEGSIFFLIAFAFGFPLQEDRLYIGVLLAVASSNLITAVPSSAGGVGPFEFAARETMVGFGLARSAATAYALVIHAVLILPVVVVGLYFLWARHISFKAVAGSNSIAQVVPVASPVDAQATRGPES